VFLFQLKSLKAKLANDAQESFNIGVFLFDMPQNFVFNKKRFFAIAACDFFPFDLVNEPAIMISLHMSA
jgi:hypothetical protein